MKRKNIAALVLAVLSIFAFGLSGCKPTPTPTPSTAIVKTTGMGTVHTTDKVKNPTSNVKIEVYSGGYAVAEGIDELTYEKAFKKNETYGGDVIRITSDYQYIKLQMLGMPEAVMYSPTGEYVFQIPGTDGQNWQKPYASDAFTKASNTIKASVATDEEIAAERNLAVNPYDFMYTNEFTVMTETDKAPEGTVPVDSVSFQAGEVLAFPHAYANRVTTGSNRPYFLARNAIDGDFRTGKHHTSYGHQSWGGGRAPTTNTSSTPANNGPAWTAENNYGYYDDLAFTVYFGRPVALTELGFVMRADDGVTNGVAHDIHYSGMTVEFSDGSEQTLTGFEFSTEQQKRSIVPVTTTYVRLKNFQRAFDTTITSEQAKTLGNWTALSEFAAYGTESNKNSAATKTTVRNTFGGKDISFKTNQFSASDLKEIIDFASVDSQTSVAASETARAWWRDAVLYSALTDAYTTAGSLDAYLFTRHASDRFKYTIQRESANAGRNQKSLPLNDVLVTPGYEGIGVVSDFGDDYLIGETYLMMNDLAPVKEGLNNYKLFNTYASNDAHMLESPSWSPNYNRGAGYYNNETGGPNASAIRPLPDGILDWWWCDAIYMGLNNFTFMTNTTGDRQYIDKAFNSYKYWRGVLRCDVENQSPNHHMNRPAGGSNTSPLTSCDHGVDAKDGRNAPWGLWHRDMDNANYLMNNWRNAGASELPLFWGRGNAWVFAALAKQMLYIDKDLYPEIYEEYKKDFIMMSETLKAHQTANGHWRASIVDPNHKDGKESTGTSGFVYGIAVGVQLGILPASEYEDVVVKGFNALLDMRNPNEKTVNGLTGRRMGYMQNVGYDAVSYPGETQVAESINAFGYGLFIHAAAAVMRMCSDYVPPELNVPADAQFGVAIVPDYNGVKL